MLFLPWLSVPIVRRFEITTPGHIAPAVVSRVGVAVVGRGHSLVTNNYYQLIIYLTDHLSSWQWLVRAEVRVGVGRVVGVNSSGSGADKVRFSVTVTGGIERWGVGWFGWCINLCWFLFRSQWWNVHKVLCLTGKKWKTGYHTHKKDWATF